MPLLPTLQGFSDRAGVVSSLLCAAHCVALAWVLTTMPIVWFTQRLWGIPLIWLARLETALAVTSLALALVGLGTGWWRHRHPGPAVAGILGMMLIGTVFFIEWHSARLLGPGLVLSGGVLLAGAHVWNWRLGRALAGGSQSFRTR